MTTILNSTSTYAKSCVASCYPSSTGDLSYGISTTCCTTDLCNGVTVENSPNEKPIVKQLSSLMCYTCSNCGVGNIGSPLDCPSNNFFCTVGEVCFFNFT